MITVDQAKELVARHTARLNRVTKELASAHSHILAEDVFAICDIPAYAQSSMDGYAIKFTESSLALSLVGEMAAGTAENIEIAYGQAARIFTGAPLPVGADTVVMQEKTAVFQGQLILNDDNLSSGANVRSPGAEIGSGLLAMAEGSLLTPAAIGFLAGIGISEVQVYPRPKVSVINTGNELISPGRPLGFGQVYESNSYALRAAMAQHGITGVEVLEAEDDLPALKTVLAVALQMSDVILLTGGVSVGDYDFVLQASALCGVEKIFHKVAQKPGKPLFFGKLGRKIVFGLPGNPSSVLSCFYNYVLPALLSLSGKDNPVTETDAVMTRDYKKAPGMTHFLKGIYNAGFATPLGAQESYRLSTFAQANCLIVLKAEKEIFKKGETVEILLLPN